MKSGRRIMLVLTLVVPVAAGAAEAMRRMSVQVQEGQLRASPSYLARPVAAVPYAAQVEILETQGGWHKARAPAGQTGWIHDSALSKKRIEYWSGDTDAQGAAADDDIALAGRGFNADVEAEMKSKHNLDFSWIDKAEKMIVSDRRKGEFLSEGGLGQQTEVQP